MPEQIPNTIDEIMVDFAGLSTALWEADYIRSGV